MINVLPPIVVSFDAQNPSLAANLQAPAPLRSVPTAAPVVSEQAPPNPVIQTGTDVFQPTTPRDISSQANASDKPQPPNAANRMFVRLIEDVYRKITRETPVKHVWQNIRCAYHELGYDSCSEYGIKVFQTEPNTLKAIGKVTMRVMTCTPWTKDWQWAQDSFGTP